MSEGQVQLLNVKTMQRWRLTEVAGTVVTVTGYNDVVYYHQIFGVGYDYHHHHCSLLFVVANGSIACDKSDNGDEKSEHEEEKEGKKWRGEGDLDYPRLIPSLNSWWD